MGRVVRLEVALYPLERRVVGKSGEDQRRVEDSVRGGLLDLETAQRSSPFTAGDGYEMPFFATQYRGELDEGPRFP